jgi:single-strand DNA-binding protein
MNNVTIIGRITHDLELKTTQSGIACLNFSIAVDRRFKNAAGEKETDFIRCTAWRKTAEIIAEHFKKGHRIAITGSLQVETWEKDGQKQSMTKVLAESVDFIESKNSGSSNFPATSEPSNYDKSQPPPSSYQEGNDELPF